MTIKKRYLPDLEWSKFVAASVVDELLVAKLLPEDQANWAREIVAQDIHIQLISGLRPEEAVS
jgi:hypothetical protein